MLRELHFGSVLLGVALVVTIAAVASGAVLAIARESGTDRDSILDRLDRIWLVASLTVVVVLTLQPGPGGFGAPLPSILNPLSRLYWGDALANTILYLPVGFLAIVHWRFKARPLVWATGLSLSFSLAVELAQLVVPINRSAEFHDVLFNALGGFAGGLLGILIVRQVRKPDYLISDRADTD